MNKTKQIKTNFLATLDEFNSNDYALTHCASREATNAVNAAAKLVTGAVHTRVAREWGNRLDYNAISPAYLLMVIDEVTEDLFGYYSSYHAKDLLRAQVKKGLKEAKGWMKT